MATLQAWVQSTQHGRGIATGAIAYVFSILEQHAGSDSDARVRLALGPVALSIGPTNLGGQQFELKAGRYFVRVRIPTGEELTDTFDIPREDSAVELPLHLAPGAPHIQLFRDGEPPRLVSIIPRPDPMLDITPTLERELSRLMVLRVTRKRTAKTARKKAAKKAAKKLPNAKPSRDKLTRSSARDGIMYREAGEAPERTAPQEVGREVFQLPTRHALFVGTRAPTQERLPKAGSDSASYQQFWTGVLAGRQPVHVTQLDGGGYRAQLSPLNALVSHSFFAQSDVVSATSFGEAPASDGAYAARHFYWSENGVARRVGVVPVPWARESPSARAEGRDAVFIEGQPSTRGGARIGVRVNCPEVTSLLDFMKSGNLVGAESLTESAAGLALATTQPYTMAAAFYFLLAIAQIRGGLGGKVFRRVKYLCDAFPSMADGAVQYGWWQLQMAAITSGTTPDASSVANRLRIARSSLLKAVRRGMPVYPQGVKLLSDGLTLIQGSEQKGLMPPLTSARSSVNTKDALAAVRWLAMRIDNREMFTVLAVDATSSAQ